MRIRYLDWKEGTKRFQDRLRLLERLFAYLLVREDGDAERALEILRRVGWAISDEVLEVASGAGGLARHLAQKSRLILTDPGDEEATRLRTLFSHRPNIEVRSWDHCTGPMSTSPETFETIICFHSLDCLDEDTAAVGGIDTTADADAAIGSVKRVRRELEALRKKLSEDRAKRIADELAVAVRTFEKDL